MTYLEQRQRDAEHQRLLQELVRLQQASGAAECRRGQPWQEPARRLAAQVRQHAAAVAAWLQERGYGLAEAAAALAVVPRTLRNWQSQGASAGAWRPPLGRPLQRAPVAQRNEVLGLLAATGPGTSLATLRAAFPHLARADLDDLLHRYRRLWRRRHTQAPYVLHWQQPGRVWAIDFAEPPAPLEGRYGYLLTVRDLASGQQLAWWPVEAPTAAVTQAVLAGLFAVAGAPLVLKSDNGSAFAAAALQDFLAAAGVEPLFSPPGWPMYNGAIEAGIGSLKARTDCHAARAGRPGHWTWEDVSAAQLEANSQARPHGPAGPSPATAWATRSLPSAEERAAFRATAARWRPQVQAELELPAEQPLTEYQSRRVNRLALQRALVEHGYLLFSRRRIPLPIPAPKVANIT